MRHFATLLRGIAAALLLVSAALGCSRDEGVPAANAGAATGIAPAPGAVAPLPAPSEPSKPIGERRAVVDRQTGETIMVDTLCGNGTCEAPGDCFHCADECKAEVCAPVLDSLKNQP